MYVVLPDDMTDAAGTRREFLSAIGVISAASLLPPEAWAATAPRSPIRMPRGLALPEDFLFAPELVYLQTGSLGPTPRPVMERTIAAWKELELNPSFYGYGAHEHAMDDVRATAARFLGCKTEEMVLTRCTTDGMNTVARSRAHDGPGASRRTALLGLRGASVRCGPRHRADPVR